MTQYGINRYPKLILIMGLLLTPISSSIAAPGILADSPLFAASNVPPNIFFEIDDSGSMDWEILTKKHWSFCDYDRDAIGYSGSNSCFGRVDNGLYINYTGSFFAYFLYFYSNPDNPYGNSCGTALESCPSTTQDADWRIRSSDFNVLFYNPSQTYQAWNGTGLGDASFTAARSDPQPGTAGYNNTHDLNDFIYEVWQDTHGFSGTAPKRGNNINRTSGGNGVVDLWDEHLRYTVSGNQITIDQVSYLPNTSSPNKGRLNESVTTITTLSGSSAHPELGGKTIAQIQQGIANWYQYSRRRSFVTKSSVSRVITENPGYRYGLSVINQHSTLFNEVPTTLSGFASHNSQLLNDFFSFDWPALGTPLRRGLKRTGKYFDNKDGRTDPIVEQCQQNFAVLFTDGYWNGSSPSAGDKDSDGKSNTLADVAKKYYDKDLSPLNNVVPSNIFDLATHQHMVTFSVAFGLTGLLTDTDNDGWPADFPGLSESDNWGNPFDSNPEKIDDLWHAAFNSKGTYVSATTPQEVSDSLTAALANIGSRVGSASSVSFNTTTLTSNTAVYLAQFSNINNSWTGNLFSFPLDPLNGDISTTPNWTAAEVLDARTSPATTRTILTYNDTQGVAFEWNNLLGSQQNDLKTNPDGSTSINAIAQARLNFIRGDRTNEQGNSGTYNFRTRNKLLGDIIHSDPIFVGQPNSNWPDTAPFPTTEPYSIFVSSMSRNGVIYAGANDGMLHGFAASTGSEVLAYIPSNLFSSSSATTGLHHLSDPAYTHRYYVDLASTVEDAYFNTGSGNAWHSVLIGGNRAGGKGIFALDVTDPSQFTEANAANIALWEFDSTDDADMGFSYSQPTIGMMKNGRWAAIFGNGYNNTGDGKAKLFILFLDGGLDGVWTAGTDYIEISTGEGSIVSSNCADPASDCNGLSSPQAADSDRDHVIDRAYAGDLKGNLWAFDLSDANPSDWAVAYSGNPLFKAGQAITNKPAITTHPTVATGSAPNLLIVFGTGQYLVADDVTSTTIQSFYGVWDHGVDKLTSSDLVEQTFESIALFNNSIDVSSEFNVLTNNPVDYIHDHGWFIRLTQHTGERVIVDPDIVNNIVFFNTWIPESTPCSTGGSGFLMSVSLKSGGQPDAIVFDLNGDDDVDEHDYLTDGITPAAIKYIATGQRFSKGFPASSSFLSDHQYTPGTEGGMIVERRRIGNFIPSGMNRFSWQELR